MTNGFVVIYKENSAYLGWVWEVWENRLKEVLISSGRHAEKTGACKMAMNARP